MMRILKKRLKLVLVSLILARDTILHLTLYEPRKLLSNLKWRAQNQHNNLFLAGPYDNSLIKAGHYSYGVIDLFSYGDSGEKLQIGSFVSIANGVKFILGGEHDPACLSSFPFSAFNPDIKNRKSCSYSKGPIVIGNHVWLGHSAIILSGVTINEFSIIGAGSVVSKDIPAMSIAVGNPIRVIKTKDINPKKLQSIMKFLEKEHLIPYEQLMKFYSGKFPFLNQ